MKNKDMRDYIIENSNNHINKIKKSLKESLEEVKSMKEGKSPKKYWRESMETLRSEINKEK
jgi:uncharacterized protein (UPF0216 family)